MNIYKKTQEKIIKDYMSLFKKPTILCMSRDSGIQKTRFFRILNGMDMRLEEYLIIKERIAALSKSSLDLFSLFTECEVELSLPEQSELSRTVSRAIRRKRLSKNNKIKLQAS